MLRILFNMWMEYIEPSWSVGNALISVFSSSDIHIAQAFSRLKIYYVLGIEQQGRETSSHSS